MLHVSWNFQGHDIKIDKVIFIPVSHGILKFGGFCYKPSNYSLKTKNSGKICLRQIVSRNICYSNAKKYFQFWENFALHKSAKIGQKVKFSKVCLVIYHRKALYA